MKTNRSISFKAIAKKLTVVLLITGSTVAAFATLGEGNKAYPGKSKPGKSLLSNKTQTNNNFSLRSGYNFRGNQVINTQTQRFVNLNTTIAYRRGSTLYILPVQKKVFLDKVIFNDDLLRSRRSY